MAGRCNISVFLVMACLVCAVGCTCDKNAGPKTPDAGFDVTVYNLYRDYLPSDREKAMGYAEMLLDGADPASSDIGLAMVADTLSHWYENDKFLFSKAIRLKEKALDIYEANNDGDKVVSAYRDLAMLYSKIGEYSSTFRYACRVLESGVASHEDIMDCRNLIGISCAECGDVETAKRHFLEYEREAREKGDSVCLFKALNNIAVYNLTVENDTVKARQFLSEAVSVCDGIRDTSSMFIIYYNLANSYLMAGDVPAGHDFLLKAEPFASGIREKGQYSYTCGMYLYKMEEYDGSIEALNRSLFYFRQGEFDQEQMKCLSMLRSLYDMKGDKEQAYEALSQYSLLESRFDRAGMLCQMFKAQRDFDDRINREILKKNKNTIILVSVVVLLVIAIACLVFVLKYRQKMYALKSRETEMRSRREILELKNLQAFQTDRLIGSVIGRLNQIRDMIDKSTVRNEISSICTELRNSKSDVQWKELEQFVPEYNKEHYERLLKAFPNLTVNERRLCVFLNMNMTTKEISAITKQTEQSIVRARSRLRHKLGISGDSVSIQEFLSRYM